MIEDSVSSSSGNEFVLPSQQVNADEEESVEGPEIIDDQDATTVITKAQTPVIDSQKTPLSESNPNQGSDKDVHKSNVKPKIQMVPTLNMKMVQEASTQTPTGQLSGNKTQVVSERTHRNQVWNKLA